MMHEGFSLLEVTVVIALIMMLAALGWQSFTIYDRLALHNDLDRLYMAIVAGARRAVLTNASHQLLFDQKNSTYQVDQQVYALSSGIEFGFIPSVQGPPASAHTPVVKAITFIKERIVFYTDGRVQPGTVYLTDARRRWVYALSCPVGHISYMRRYRYDRDAWVLIV